MPRLCPECHYRHRHWITCYAANKQRIEIERGEDFWTGEKMTPQEVAALREWNGYAADEPIVKEIP